MSPGEDIQMHIAGCKRARGLVSLVTPVLAFGLIGGAFADETPASPQSQQSPQPVAATPAQPPVDSGPPAPSTAATQATTPAADANTAAAQPATAAAQGPRKIVLLPAEFLVFQLGAGGITEPVPDWTDAAKSSLTAAASHMLTTDSRFELTQLPELTSEEQGVLREHVELFKIAAGDAISMVQFGGKVWKDKKDNFDYTIGDGLGYLRARTGADYAFVIGGSEFKQSGGSVFMQLALAAAGIGVAGGGTFVYTGIIDLSSGNITWLNSLSGQEVLGMTRTDVRKPEAAESVLRQLFAKYPSSQLFTFRMF
jgi:hypothetical protein